MYFLITSGKDQGDPCRLAGQAAQEEDRARRGKAQEQQP